MKTTRKNTCKSTKGFTLVEIMIVVAIISLLAAIAVPNFLRARSTSAAMDFAAKEFSVPRDSIQFDNALRGSGTKSDPLHIKFEIRGQPGGNTAHTAEVTATSVLTLDGQPYVSIPKLSVPADPAAPK